MKRLLKKMDKILCKPQFEVFSWRLKMSEEERNLKIEELGKDEHGYTIMNNLDDSFYKNNFETSEVNVNLREIQRENEQLKTLLSEKENKLLIKENEILKLQLNLKNMNNKCNEW